MRKKVGIKSVLSYQYKIFCATDGIIPDWKWLPQSGLGKVDNKNTMVITGKEDVSYIFRKTKAVMTDKHCCEELEHACKTTFGDKFKYVYSTPVISTKFNEWDMVLDMNGEYCLHHYAHLTSH